MNPNSLAIILNDFQEPGILNIESFVNIFINQMDVEHAIQTVKCTLKKVKLANGDHYLSIHFLNSQPDENGLSQAHKLFNRLIHPKHNLDHLPPK